ncbi:MAG: helix-turn-helix transcriptional regulator [Phyllobacteriaceae bacterium]|nr:helix-turn-helix transcriptional regulator [Phyllobacteriaceae bacterium]
MRKKPTELFAEWNAAVAGQVEKGPTEKGYRDLVASMLDFDALMVFEYGQAKAKAVYHHVARERRKVIIDDYLQGPFLLDPFYAHSIVNPDSGLMVMRQLSPDRFQKSEFYRQHYHLTGIADEIGIAFKANKGASIVLSITRNKDQRLFSAKEKALFESAAPVLSALGKKLWKNSAANSAPPRASLLESAFREFGRDILSKREVEIVLLILKGHSSLSIGEVLNISPGTVKIHRKNVYAKLNISSQAELFNKFIGHLSESWRR